MRNVKNLFVGDVIVVENQPENMGERGDYLLVVGTVPDGAMGESTHEVMCIGPDRFRDVEITARTPVAWVNIEDLGRVQRKARYTRHVTFTRV